jgi:hypothetical protein
MADDIIDLSAERNRREEPDPEFVTADEYGRKLYTFLASYDVGDKCFSLRFIAYDEDDAQAKVAGMRESIRYDGKLFSSIPV